MGIHAQKIASPLYCNYKIGVYEIVTENRRSEATFLRGSCALPVYIAFIVGACRKNMLIGVPSRNTVPIWQAYNLTTELLASWRTYYQFFGKIAAICGRSCLKRRSYL